MDPSSKVQDSQETQHIVTKISISKSPAPQILKTHIFLYPKFIPPRKWSLILGPRSRIQAPGSRFLDHGSRILDLGSWIQDPRSRIHQKQEIFVPKLEFPNHQPLKLIKFRYSCNPNPTQVMAKLLKNFCWMLGGGGALEKHHCGGSLKEMQQQRNGEQLAAGGVEPLAGGMNVGWKYMCV